MKKIIAIGGALSKATNNNIENEILRLCRKNPKILIIPTAGYDAGKYIVDILRNTEEKFKTNLENIDILYLWDVQITPKYINYIKKQILSSDIIYVGGGNTKDMINIWKKYSVDKMIIDAYKKDKVMCGSSAGAICWFKDGNSDSLKMKNPKAPLIKVDGLGIIDALCCPHYDTEKDRKKSLENMMKRTKGVAIAIDESCAIEILDDKYKVLIGKKSGNVYRTYWKDTKYYLEKIPNDGKLRFLKELLDKNSILK